MSSSAKPNLIHIAIAVAAIGLVLLGIKSDATPLAWTGIALVVSALVLAWYATQEGIETALRESERANAADDARRHAERQLVESIETGGDGRWERDYTLRQTRISPSFEALLGIPRGRLAEQGIAPEDLIHPADLPRLRAAFQAHQTLFEPFLIELRMRHTDGHYLWIRTRGHSERDLAGRVLHMTGTVTDITDLKASLERFRDLAEMTSDWYWEQDEYFRFTRFDRGSQHSPKNTEFLIGKTRFELPLDVAPEALAAHRATLEAHRPFRRFEYRIPDDKGNWIWVSVSGKPVFDDSGRFVGYRGTASEITERKEMERELIAHRDHLTQLVESQTADMQRAKDMAERASQAKSEFMANMSHELRTPMHAVLAFARLGQAKAAAASPEKIKEYFDQVVANGERLLELVDAVLDLSKLEAGKLRTVFALVDMRQITEDLVRELSALAEARQLSIEIVAGSCDTQINGDALRLTQVLRNLLGNALKFTPPGNRIFVEFSPDKLMAGRRADDHGEIPALRLSVVDTGIGIPEDELEAVFEKFFQSSRTNTGAGGTGLGLAICREIVQAHRGTIVARNHPEKGAIFEVVLPR